MYPNFANAKYYFDFTSGVVPPGGTFVSPFRALQFNKALNTITQSATNNGTFIPGLGLVLRPGAGMAPTTVIGGRTVNYAYDMIMANAAAVDASDNAKISATLMNANYIAGMRTTNQAAAAITRTDDVTSGVGYLWTSGSVLAANYNFGNCKITVSTTKNSASLASPFAIPPAISFAIVPIKKDGILLGQFGTISDGYPVTGANCLTSDYVVRVDMTHPSLEIGKKAIISASHPAVLNWPTQQQLLQLHPEIFTQINETNLVFGFSVSAANMEIHVDRLTIANSQIGAPVYDEETCCKDFPFLLPAEFAMPNVLDAEYFEAQVTGIAPNDTVCFLEGAFSFTGQAWTYTNSRIFTLRNSVLQNGGSAGQNVESIGMHPGGGSYELNTGYDATNANAKEANRKNITQSIPEFSPAVYDADKFWYPFRIVFKRSTTGWRLYHNGVSLNLNDANDFENVCASFVNPANIAKLVIGAGRTATFHFANEEFFAMSRVAWFNSIDYTDEELQGFSELPGNGFGGGDSGWPAFPEVIQLPVEL